LLADGDRHDEHMDSRFVRSQAGDDDVKHGGEGLAAVGDALVDDDAGEPDSSAQERKSTECMEPRPRPLARPPLLPYLYVVSSASRYDLTAFSSPTNACTVRTLPITCANLQQREYARVHRAQSLRP